MLSSFIQGRQAGGLKGIDLTPERRREARTTVPPGVTLVGASATALPLRTASFDLAVQSTVFTSILDRNARRIGASEIVRVPDDPGIVVWYD